MDEAGGLMDGVDRRGEPAAASAAPLICEAWAWRRARAEGGIPPRLAVDGGGGGRRPRPLVVGGVSPKPTAGDEAEGAEGASTAAGVVSES